MLVLGNLDSFLNHDWGVFVHQIEQLDHVRVQHPDAAAAGRRADLAFVFGAMNVDVAVARIGILLIQSVEP